MVLSSGADSRTCHPLRPPQVLPEFLLTVTMILLLVATSDRTIRKGIKNFKKESAERMVRTIVGSHGAERNSKGVQLFPAPRCYRCSAQLTRQSTSRQRLQEESGGALLL